MLLALSIHSASGGRNGNSVLMITVNTGRFLSSPKDVCVLPFFTLVAGLLARSQYSEGLATGLVPLCLQANGSQDSKLPLHAAHVALPT